MLSKLTRILLALVTAFVFTGRMEAAAEHCTRLLEQAAAKAGAEAPPCHDTQAADTMPDGEESHGASHDDGKSAKDATGGCECTAALKICMDIEGSTVSVRIEPHAWLAPGDARLDSSQLDPDLRPPRV